MNIFYCTDMACLRRICSKSHLAGKQKLSHKDQQKAYACGSHEFDKKSQDASEG